MALVLKLRRHGYVLVMQVVNLLLAALPFNALRLLILKAVGVKLGRRVVCERRVRLDFPWRLAIGSNCYISRQVYLDCRGGRITIGDDSDISEGATIYTLSHDIQSADFGPKRGDVQVGARNWICARAIVLPGARLGTGSVLGANSVFSGSAADFALLVGNPARQVKQLDAARASRVRK